METIKYLLAWSLKAAFAFFFAAFVWFLVSLFFPTMSLRNIVSSSTASSSSLLGDILPSPRAYSGLLGKGGKKNMPQEYVHGSPFNGYVSSSTDGYRYSTYSYATYTSSDVVGTSSYEVQNTQTTSSQTEKEGDVQASSLEMEEAPASVRELYVRNLSVYEGGHIYTGLSFVGEARSTMFRDGKFPIITIDHTGRVVGISFAIATTDWSVPGWTRFETKIPYVMPNNTPCAMIFEEGQTQVERASRQPVRVPIQVRCN